MPRLKPRASAQRTKTDGVCFVHYAYASLLLIGLACLAALIAPFTSRAAGPSAGRTLSFDERVAYQRAVEEVYWRHTEWPGHNQKPKPSLDEVVPLEATRAKVADGLRKSDALARLWNSPVTPAQLQAEVTRMARETRRPEVLRELWRALGDDPFVIAEVLARPALVDRLARTSFEAGAPEASFDAWWKGEGEQYAAAETPAGEDFAYQLADINAAADDTWSPTQTLPISNGPAVWTGSEVIIWGGATSLGGRTNLGSRYNPATDTWTSVSTVNAPSARTAHTAVWTGTEFLVWGGSLGTVSSGHGSINNTTNTGGRYNPATDTWTPTSINGAPSSSSSFAFWTGSKLMVLGPSGGGVTYDPSTDTWKVISLANSPGANTGQRAVWTGKEVFFWGGINSTTGKRGGLYNPEANTWRQPNTFNAPSERNGFTMVWTGKEAIVWGGYEGNTITLNTGGRYNPETDTWTPTSTANAAESRYGHTAVWTGSEMVVYGGDSRPNGGPDKLINTGGRYNPATDTWTLTSTANAPLKNNHVAVWTGSEMFVWGGRHVSQTVFREAARYRPSTDSWIPANNHDSVPSAKLGVWSGAELIIWGKAPGCGGACSSTGGRYDPATNLWRAMNVTNAPSGDAADNATAVWTGKEMIVAGGRYNPLTDTWTRISTVGAPVNVNTAAVWAGTELLVWGGGTTPENNPAPAGGRYNPATDTWRPMSTTGAPSARDMHSAVWTGSEMVVWGGSGYFSGSQTNTGGRYNPETDTWRPTTTAGAPEARLYNTAVWTGSEMVIWGGWVYSNEGSRYLNTGARYNPVSDTWQPTSTDGAPQARSHHRAVWTGSTMIVWGGLVPVSWTSTGDPVYTGARYNPSTDVWTPTSLRSAPSRRDSHVQVWTGTQMIVWGGTGPSGAPTQDGAVYNASGAAPGNQMPTARLTGPAGGAAFQSGDTVALSAEASDADGAVTTVRFYANGALVGTATQAPFAFDWKEVRGGSYRLTAVAVDDAGGEGRSAGVDIAVAPSTAPPVCVLTAPADGSNYAYGDSVRMEATATANRDRAIAKVEFLVDGRMVTYYEPPTYNAPWWHLYQANQAGARSLAARCTDNAGGVTTSAARVVNVAEQGYTISGQLLDDRGFIIAGVRVRLDGPAGTAPRYATTTVGGNGNYFFGDLKPGETYTVTPEAGAWKFSPESNTYASISRDWPTQHFYGTRAGYGISGHLRDAQGHPIYPATINLSGSKTASTNVDSTGYYFFSNLTPGGTYTVQPYKNLYGFEPNFRTFENLSAEQTADFTATPQTTTHTIAGRVLDDKGAPVGGLRIKLNTVRVSSTQFRTTDAYGRYSFDAVPAGETCSIFPEDFTYAYGFTPYIPRTYYGLAQDVADADFVATPRTVAGRVTQSGSGLAGVTVTLEGPQGGTATTGDDGAFAFRGVTVRGDYTVTAAKDGYALTPALHTLKDLKEDMTADFAAAKETPLLQFSQAVFPAAESAYHTTVTVTRTGDASSPLKVNYQTEDGTASRLNDYTTAVGTLEFAAGETSKTFYVLLTDDGHQEGDETVRLVLSNPTGGAALGGQATADVLIAASDDPPPASNPVEASSDFVRQHYHDFFSRDADAPGLAHWTNVVESCGADVQCREVTRINVSGAFFLSIEFQQTGYLVERVYKAAYGDATGTSTLGGPHTLQVPIIRLGEFLPDTQRIGRGVVVHQPGWEELLESNKEAYFLEFVQRQRFLDAFPLSMTPARFVDQLNQRTGGALDADERQALVNELSANNTTAGRASVLRKVAEDSTLAETEKNRAFVLMQYFGYMRRDPNGGQDTDHTGYDFWLGNLERFNGNFVQAELVKAFITSTEYRQRFGR